MTTASELKDELMRVRRDARELHSHDEVMAAIGRVAVRLTTDYSERCPVFVTIMNGGIVFAGQLLTRLDFPWKWTTSTPAAIWAKPAAATCTGSLPQRQPERPRRGDPRRHPR